METGEQQEKQRGEHLKPWQFKPGQSGNPSGRPKGRKSLKTFAKEYLEALSDEEKLEFMEGLDKKTIWEMSEGKPEAVLTDPNGNALQQVLVKIIRDGDKPGSN